jgi:Dna[CI] antecedent, DciA
VESRLCRAALKIIGVQPAELWFTLGVMWSPKNFAARQRVLAQWRGVDYAPLEKARAVREKLPGDVLPALLKELRLDARQAEAEVVKVWNALIDPVVTAHAQPANLHKGTLFVNVDSSVWLAEIVRYRRREILERLQTSFGKSVIQKISFRMG